LVANLIRYCGLLHDTKSASEQIAALGKGPSPQVGDGQE